MCGLNIRHFSSIISLLILKTKQKNQQIWKQWKIFFDSSAVHKEWNAVFMSNNKKMLCCRILMIIFFPECYLKSTCESVSAFFPELRMSVFVSRPSQDADLIWAHQKLGGPPPPPPPPASFFPFLKFFFKNLNIISLVGSFFLFFLNPLRFSAFCLWCMFFRLACCLFWLFFSGKQSFAFILLKRSPGFYWKQ